MPKYATDDPRQLWRFINGEMWRGYHFSDTRDENKALAKYLRDAGIPARAIVLPETSPMNYGMGAAERYAIYVRVKDLKASNEIAQKIEDYEAQKSTG